MNESSALVDDDEDSDEMDPVLEQKIDEAFTLMVACAAVAGLLGAASLALGFFATKAGLFEVLGLASNSATLHLSIGWREWLAGFATLLTSAGVIGFVCWATWTVVKLLGRAGRTAARVDPSAESVGG